MNNSAIKNYPLYFTSLNCAYRQEGIYRPNGFLAEQLMFVVSGNGVMTLNGEEYVLYPNTAVFFGSNVSHSYIGTDEDFVTAWITFRGELLPFLHSYFNVGKTLVCYDVDTGKYLGMMRELETEYTSNARESLMSSMTYRILTHFFSAANSMGERNSIEKAELYIIRNFSKKIYLDELTSISGMSKSKFCVMAKERWGMTAFEKIMDIRLNYAKTLIEKNSDIKITECALQCGFEDASYFCRCYKKKFGESPKCNKTGAD